MPEHKKTAVRCVLEYFLQNTNEGISVSELTKKINDVKEETIRRVLKNLCNEEILSKEKVGRTNYYTLINEEKAEQYKQPPEFSVDDNYDDGFPKFTEGNFNKIIQAIKNNPRYGGQFNDSEQNDSLIYSKDYIKQNWHKMEKKTSRSRRLEIISSILYRIDYENSTHMSSGIGVVALSEAIEKYNGENGKENIFELAKNPNESSFKAINALAFGNTTSAMQTEKRESEEEKTEKQYYLMSLVSKFFTYVNRFGYREGSKGENQFSIVDNVVLLALPYYLNAVESEDKLINRYKNNIIRAGDAIKIKNYGEYYKLIGEILNSSSINIGKFDREKLDRVLWYYFRRGTSPINYEAAKSKFQELVVKKRKTKMENRNK